MNELIGFVSDMIIPKHSDFVILKVADMRKLETAPKFYLSKDNVC